MAQGTAWHADGLNVNHMSYVLICVNNWSPVGGALGKFVELSGGGALLGEVSQWGQALRFDNLTPLPDHSASWQLMGCDQAAS